MNLTLEDPSIMANHGLCVGHSNKLQTEVEQISDFIYFEEPRE